MSSNSLVKFLSDFPCFQSEKQLVSHIEEFLTKDFLARPLLVYSIQNKVDVITFDKCRTVIGKADRLKLYSSKILDQLISNKRELKDFKSFSIKIENCYYYYINLGTRRNQFYFSIFSSCEHIADDYLVAISDFSRSHLNLIDQIEELKASQELIHIDDVTGLYNQRKLYKDISFLVEKNKIEHDPFCVLFVDIDYFKKVNDNYGHLVGTRLLESMAKEIKSMLRDSDISYRYGGDEFVIILTNSDAISGKLVGERILSKIKNKDFILDPKDISKRIKLSVSIGVAEFPTDAKTSDEVLAIADRMMYEAKESGRGVVFNTQDVFKSSLRKIVEHK